MSAKHSGGNICRIGVLPELDGTCCRQQHGGLYSPPCTRAPILRSATGASRGGRPHSDPPKQLKDFISPPLPKEPAESADPWAAVPKRLGTCRRLMHVSIIHGLSSSY